MSKKTQTQGNQTTAFNFDPSAMAQYGQNIATAFPQLRNFASNPFNNTQFNFESAMGQDQAARTGQRNMSNITGNAGVLGYGTNGGLMNEMMSNASRATSGMQAQAFRGAMGNAIQRQMSSLGTLAGWNPLMTGSNSNFNQTQTQSGLGTWLPQLISGGIGAGMNAFMGGSGGGGGMPGAAASAGMGVGSSGSGMSGIGGGLGQIFGSTPGYGYGSNSSAYNPFMMFAGGAPR